MIELSLTRGFSGFSAPRRRSCVWLRAIAGLGLKRCRPERGGSAVRYSRRELEDYARRLLEACGIDAAQGNVVARTLTHGEMSGRTSHGLARLPYYLELIEAGQLARSGEPTLVMDSSSTVLWDGNLLAGPFLVERALDFALDRVRETGTSTVVIRRAQYTGCHEAHLLRAVDAGVMMILAGSGPASRRVAPYGGRSAVFAPDPFAVGIPTSGDAVVLDMTMASTSNSVVRQYYEHGRRLPFPWLLDAAGAPTDDPSVLFEHPIGTILPLGGIDNGHKGFGLVLMIEALTLALGGFGRSAEPVHPNQSLFIQLINPESFAGLESFQREMDWIVSACRASEPAPGAGPVRLPGERAAALRQEHAVSGVAVSDLVMDRLSDWGKRLGVRPPTEIE